MKNSITLKFKKKFLRQDRKTKHAKRKRPKFDCITFRDFCKEYHKYKRKAVIQEKQ